jgi:hypothetical protein
MSISTIIFYILTPVGAYIIDLTLSILVIILSFPISWLLIQIQNKFENNPSLFKFRSDMVFTGILRGFLVVYLLDYQFSKYVSIWWVAITMLTMSYLNYLTWNKERPFLYELSLVVSPILGYVIGFIFILL